MLIDHIWTFVLSLCDADTGLQVLCLLQYETINFNSSWVHFSLVLAVNQHQMFYTINNLTLDKTE